MALRLIRRHVKIRKALDQSSWDAATDLINAWTTAGEIGVVKLEAPTIR